MSFDKKTQMPESRPCLIRRKSSVDDDSMIMPLHVPVEENESPKHRESSWIWIVFVFAASFGVGLVCVWSDLLLVGFVALTLRRYCKYRPQKGHEETNMACVKRFIDFSKEFIGVGVGITAFVLWFETLEADKKTSPPVASSFKTTYNDPCFRTTQALREAVDSYVENDGPETDLARRRGWPIGNWCVRYVEDFSTLFSVQRNPSLENFDEYLYSWDTTHAKNMSHMFEGQVKFNRDISHWDVSGAVDLTGMFEGAEAFNQDVSTWDVSKTRFMDSMFAGASTFNQDLSSWDVSSVETMTFLFQGAHSFDQPLGSWDTSKKEGAAMKSLFQGASSFNQNLSTWDVSRLTDLSQMFELATSFNQDLSQWNLAGATNLTAMFAGASAFSQDLCSWTTVLSASTFVVDAFEGTACPVKGISDTSLCTQCT